MASGEVLAQSRQKWNLVDRLRLDTFMFVVTDFRQRSIRLEAFDDVDWSSPASCTASNSAAKVDFIGQVPFISNKAKF